MNKILFTILITFISTYSSFSKEYCFIISGLKKDINTIYRLATFDYDHKLKQKVSTNSMEYFGLSCSTKENWSSLINSINSTPEKSNILIVHLGHGSKKGIETNDDEKDIPYEKVESDLRSVSQHRKIYGMFSSCYSGNIVAHKLVNDIKSGKTDKSIDNLCVNTSSRPFQVSYNTSDIFLRDLPLEVLNKNFEYPARSLKGLRNFKDLFKYQKDGLTSSIPFDSLGLSKFYEFRLTPPDHISEDELLDHYYKAGFYYDQIREYFYEKDYNFYQSTDRYSGEFVVKYEQPYIDKILQFLGPISKSNMIQKYFSEKTDRNLIELSAEFLKEQDYHLNRFVNELPEDLDSYPFYASDFQNFYDEFNGYDSLLFSRKSSCFNQFSKLNELIKDFEEKSKLTKKMQKSILETRECINNFKSISFFSGIRFLGRSPRVFSGWSRSVKFESEIDSDNFNSIGLEAYIKSAFDLYNNLVNSNNFNDQVENIKLLLGLKNVLKLYFVISKSYSTCRGLYWEYYNYLTSRKNGVYLDLSNLVNMGKRKDVIGCFQSGTRDGNFFGTLVNPRPFFGYTASDSDIITTTILGKRRYDGNRESRRAAYKFYENFVSSQSMVVDLMGVIKDFDEKGLTEIKYSDIIEDNQITSIEDFSEIIERHPLKENPLFKILHLFGGTSYSEGVGDDAFSRTSPTYLFAPQVARQIFLLSLEKEVEETSIDYRRKKACGYPK